MNNHPVQFPFLECESASEPPDYYLRLYQHQLMGVAPKTALWNCPPANYDSDGTMRLVAWMIVHIAPMVVDTPAKAFGGLLAKERFTNIFTPSDLAFAWNTVQYGLEHWKRWGQFKLEKGHDPPASVEMHLGGFLYDDGLASEESKVRCDRIQFEFLLHYYGPSVTAMRLQSMVEQMVEEVSTPWLSDQLNSLLCREDIFPNMSRLRDFITHRVFYCVHD